MPPYASETRRAIMIRFPLAYALLLVGTLVAACDHGSSAVSPPAEHACGAGGVVTLGVRQATTLDCSAGTSVQLAGNGASYLVVPQFATGNVSKAATSYDAHFTRTHDGVGLGLAISRDLSRGMGGDLTVVSTLDKGSIFTLTLPGSQVNARTAEPPS